MSTTSSRRLRRAVLCAVAAAALVPARRVGRPATPSDDPPDRPSPPTTEAPPPIEEPLPDPPPPPPSPSPGPGPTVPPNPIRQPRYVLQAIQFHAIDESGYDWLGSDEIFGAFYADGNIAMTDVFGDVDTGDTRQFGVTERCITPIAALVPGTDDGDGRWSSESGDQWRSAEQGRAAPIDVTIALFEDDSPFEFWTWSCFYRDNVPPHDCPDDRIGERDLSFSAAELAAVMPAVGDAYEETIELGGVCGGADGCGATGPWYSVTYRLTRFPDAFATNG